MDHRPIGNFAEEVERRATERRLEVFLTCRDEGRSLADASLEGRPSLPRLINAATNLASFADAAIAIVTEEHRPPLACTSGCSYCCRKPGVLISIPELLRMLSHIHATFEQKELSALCDRSLTYVERLQGRSFDSPTRESFPCPLLQDDRCSVYEVRPLTCRGYNSTSVDACRKAHDTTEASVPIFVLIKDAVDGATVGAGQALDGVGFCRSMVDLGTALNIVLGASDDVADAIANGDSRLRPAENATWIDELWRRVQRTARTMGIKV